MGSYQRASVHVHKFVRQVLKEEFVPAATPGRVEYQLLLFPSVLFHRDPSSDYLTFRPFVL